jgi:ParB/RepB/Spo0J family partition protein
MRDILSKFDRRGVNRVLRIQYVPTDMLAPNTYNPNLHDPDSFDMLIKSVGYFGFTQPIVVRQGSMEIIDGEHRWRVACVLDLDEVPVCIIPLTDDEMRIASIIHNRARGMEDGEMIDKIESSVDALLTNELLLKDR